MSRFAGAVALVTGGARGIGSACAEVLARDGATVVLTDVLTEAGEATAVSLRAKGYSVTFRKHDVSSAEEWAAMADAVVTAHGKWTILVNNAGINLPVTIEDAAPEDFERLFRVNLLGPFLGMKQAVRAMKAAGGAIVNIASNSTRNVVPLTTLYSPLKAGLANLTKVVALHCAAEGYNIRVNSVHPGPTDTAMMTGGSVRAADIPQVRRLIEAVPLRRLGRPEEIAEAVAFLASDAASYITAEEIFVDAGLTISMSK